MAVNRREFKNSFINAFIKNKVFNEIYCLYGINISIQKFVSL